MSVLKEIEIQLNQIFKTLSKYGKTLESVEKDIAQLKVNSHPPAFKKEAYEDLVNKLTVIEDKLKQRERE